MSNPNNGPPLDPLIPFNLLATAPVPTTQPVTFNLVDGQMILVVHPAGPLVAQPAGALVDQPAAFQLAELLQFALPVGAQVVPLADAQITLPAGAQVDQPAAFQLAELLQIVPPAGAQVAPYPLSRHHATGTNPST